MSVRAKHPRLSPKSRARQSGFSMVETLVSIVIFSLGVLGIVQFQATAVSMSSEARNRIEASMLAESIVHTVWLDRANMTSYEYTGAGHAPDAIKGWVASIAENLPNGRGIVDANPTQGTVRVEVRWTPLRAASESRYITVATMRGAQ